MKKLYSVMMMLAMMVAALSLTACGGDDDGGNSDDNVSLVGVWECVNVNWGRLNQNMSDSNPIGQKLYLNSDYTYTFSEGRNKKSGNWSQSGTKLTIKQKGSSIEIVYTIINQTSTNLTIVESEFGVTYSFKKVK